jgi:hypothetical protein
MCFKNKKQKVFEQHVNERFECVKKQYPELYITEIKLQFFPLCYATMEARPSIIDFLLSFKNDKRRFIILINNGTQYRKYAFPLYTVSDEVLDGWLAHELGHIVFYQTLSRSELFRTSLRFIFDKKYKKSFESGADISAEEHGFKEALHKGVELLLNDPNVSEKYKERMKRFYKVN